MFSTAQNAADLLYHHAKFGEAGTTHATTRAKSLMFFLFVFVRHAFGKTEFVNAISQ